MPMMNGCKLKRKGFFLKKLVKNYISKKKRTGFFTELYLIFTFWKYSMKKKLSVLNAVLK